MTSLPDPAEIEQVVRAEDGLMAGFRAGSGYIDFSTSAPASVCALAADLVPIDVTMMDAPVSGGPKGAASKKLTIWVGGARPAYDRYKPVLDGSSSCRPTRRPGRSRSSLSICRGRATCLKSG